MSNEPIKRTFTRHKSNRRRKNTFFDNDLLAEHYEWAAEMIRNAFPDSLITFGSFHHGVDYGLCISIFLRNGFQAHTHTECKCGSLNAAPDKKNAINDFIIEIIQSNEEYRSTRGDLSKGATA